MKKEIEDPKACAYNPCVNKTKLKTVIFYKENLSITETLTIHTFLVHKLLDMNIDHRRVRRIQSVDHSFCANNILCQIVGSRMKSEKNLESGDGESNEECV